MFKLDREAPATSEVNTNRLIIKLNKNIQAEAKVTPKELKDTSQAVVPVIEQVNEPMFEIY